MGSVCTEHHRRWRRQTWRKIDQKFTTLPATIHFGQRIRIQPTADRKQFVQSYNKAKHASSAHVRTSVQCWWRSGGQQRKKKTVNSEMRALNWWSPHGSHASVCVVKCKMFRVTSWTSFRGQFVVFRSFVRPFFYLKWKLFINTQNRMNVIRSRAVPPFTHLSVPRRGWHNVLYDNIYRID